MAIFRRGLILGKQPWRLRGFCLDRVDDVSGKSGTGIVAWGVRFPSGQCGLIWNGKVRTFTVYESEAMIEEIHGHEGATHLRWLRNLSEDDFAEPSTLTPPEMPRPSEVLFVCAYKSIPMVSGAPLQQKIQAGMMWDSGELAMEWIGAKRSIVHYPSLDEWRELHSAPDVSVYFTHPFSAEAAQLDDAPRFAHIMGEIFDNRATQLEDALTERLQRYRYQNPDQT